MSPLSPTLNHWWWMLVALLCVGALMSIARSWLEARERANHKVEDDVLPNARLQLKPHDNQVVDILTGLATRLWLEDQLAAAVMRAEAKQRKLALLYIDLDGFKPVNDSFGYASGDTLLREVGLRLQGMGRSTDTIARMGGDEFLMLLDGDPDSASCALVADRIRHNLQRPFMIHGREVRLSCSIGIVMFPEHGPRSKLIARADAAMMAAKHAGGNMHCFFDTSMDHDAESAIDLQRDLRAAIESSTGLELYFQPKIDGRNGRVMGVEALLRWHHPGKGMISPGTFIPVAERFGLIGSLGQWVIEDACKQVRAWLDLGMSVRVSINLSVHQLRQADLVDRIRESLARYEVPPELITFEITESAAMEDAQASLRIFERIAETRVSLSIDDFGTGYSSLSYLRKLPATELKIDRSFVQDMDKEEDAKAIVRAVIKLAHALNMSVVAEGVETEAQQDILVRMGCDQLQGFLYAKPMPARNLYAWMTSDDLPANKPYFKQSHFNEDDSEASSSSQA